MTGQTKQFTRIADSGNENTGVFCPDCGVRIYQIPKYIQGVLALKPEHLTTRVGSDPTTLSG
jgi:hypothetical protein